MTLLANGFPHPGIWYEEAAEAVAILRGTGRAVDYRPPNG